MSREDALKILDLDQNASDAQIKKRYKELMSRIHPDKGGSKHLAAQLNQAKDVLLG